MITKFEMRHRSGGERWDMTEAADNVVLTSDINYTASTLTFDLYMNTSKYKVQNGDVVMFQWSKNKTFYGYVFKWSANEQGKVSVTSYDKLRYLKNNDSVVFKAGTLAARFQQILSRAELRGSAKASPPGKLKAAIYDNKSYFDMLKEGIENTKTDSGQAFFLRDNYGKIELCKVPVKTLTINVDDKTNAISYSISRSIDQNTANFVKVVTENKEKSKKKSSTAKGTSATKVTGFSSKDASGSSVKRWGKLTYVDKPTTTKKMNDAQLQARAKALLKQKNKQTNSLTIKVIGDINFQAGNAVKIKIDGLKNYGVSSPTMIITKATHNFGTNYTVDLEMRL